ncbi:hypothetical protein K525DRAFT_216372 [Schizophyllum commune Loenen D]|nr:hypothetical protein K525DRAFT_216372 [Schizophyllum commune Loenen D]
MSSSAPMGRRLYLGKLPPDTAPEDVKKTFGAYGTVVDCRVMTGFGFIEYESSKDAEDAVNEMNGKTFNGNSIAVEFARENRPRREPFERDREYGAPRRRPGGFRVLVTGVSRDTSWQDLKDFGREAGSVTFADIDRDVPGQGVLEYMSRDDADHAVRYLDRRDLRGHPVNVTLDDSRGGADNYRRDSRYDRDDRRDYDRRDYDRRDDRGYRGGRSRSPRRDRYDDRRARSPPSRRDLDDRKPSGYDGYSRYDYDYPYERRRPDDRDRRRDDKVEDRPSRSSGGDRDRESSRW